MKKINIAILMGGQSAEREVSLRTGKKIASFLDRKKYNIQLIEISKTGKWLLKKDIGQIKSHYAVGVQPEIADTQTKELAAQSQSLSPEFQKQQRKIDLVFIALHGPKGEDGTVQGMLELMGLPYTGSGILASALGMDKEKALQMFKFNGLNVPKYIVVGADDLQNNNGIPYPEKLGTRNNRIVVKPNALGSSVGITIVQNKSLLQKAIKEALEYDSKVLVEEYINGLEVTCGIIENFKGKKYFALPPVEIVPKQDKFFTYKAKYTPGATEEICPARLTPSMTRKVKQAAITAHKALGCRHYSRTDMIIKKNKIYVLEINTLPGMTETSLLPQEAKVVELEFTELLDHIIELAIN